MSERGSFYRKIIYLIIIAVLLLPISRLGAPSTLEDQGGTLAQLRKEHGLGQANLGEIDPASEALRLATLGMRGIAASLLWSKANEYKKTEDWTSFQATLNQLAKLQPYFITFWRHQAWNLSYNVSVELDDVQDRYHYVIQGIEFLKKGTLYNRFSPILLSELGWFNGNKIGRADEHEIYRRLYKADNDFHPPSRPAEDRDNWLVSKEWYTKAISAVDDRKQSLGNKNPTTFYNDMPKAQINYSEAIVGEGTFGEKARAAWETGARLWSDYGNRSLRSSRGFYIRLTELDKWEQYQQEMMNRLYDMSPGTQEKLIEERRAELSQEQLDALAKDLGDRSDEERRLAYEAEDSLVISAEDVAARIAEEMPEKAAEARKLARRLADNQVRVALIRNNRDVVNYEYWKTRCDLEQEDATLKAHELAFEAKQAFEIDVDYTKSKQLYEESFALWAEALAAYPELPDDSATGADIMEIVDHYSRVLEVLELSLTDEQIAESFPLWNIVEANDMERHYAGAIEARRARIDSNANPLLQDDPDEPKEATP